MRTIHTYKLSMQIDGVQILAMPVGSHIVHVMFQGQTPHIWAEVNDHEQQTEMREFIIVATGQSLDPYSYADCAHVATFHTLAGEFVFHLYELQEHGD